MHFSSPDLIPQFKPSLRVDALHSQQIIISSERERLVLVSAEVRQVAMLIDGQRNVAQIAQSLQGSLDFQDVLGALEFLAEKGHLLVASEAAVRQAPARAFWELLGGQGTNALEHLAARAVDIEAVAGLTVEHARSALQAGGVRLLQGARLKIVLTDDYRRPELLAICDAAAASDHAVLLVKPVGSQPSLGPLIHPQFGSCLRCLQFWCGINRPVETLLQRLQQETIFLPLAQAEAGGQAVYGLLAAAVANLLALQQDRVPLKDHVLSLDLRQMQTSRHAVVRRPQCPHCGNPQHMQEQAASALQLQPVAGVAQRDGGYRQCEPGLTYDRYKHLISNLCGPVAYLHRMPRRHIGLRKVYVAGYLVCPQTIAEENNFDKICAGKGQSDEQARTSALCEALERFSGVYQGDEACLRASLSDLQQTGQRVLAFNDLQHFSCQQFARRESLNRLSQDRRRHIPQAQAAEAEIDWTPAWSLRDGQKTWVPLAYCYAETPPASGWAYGMHNPNGAAAGNCREEAVLQGFLELVERDAVAIWWYNRIARPQIALESFAEPWFMRLHAEYASLGWQLWVLDLTHDLGIPVCAALAWQQDEGRFAIGFGCHLQAKLAVQRALTEVNQLFEPEGNSRAPWDAALLGAQDFLFPHGPAVSAAQIPSWGGQDLREDILACCTLLAKHDMDLLVVDKTRPDIGLAVVQVIVPPLRHFWPRLGPGRLYDVPLALGWLAQAVAEDDLNPAPLFL